MYSLLEYKQALLLYAKRIAGEGFRVKAQASSGSCILVRCMYRLDDL